MERSKDTITWELWASDPSIGAGAQATRKRVLRDWAVANGKSSPTEALDDIFLDKVTPYLTALIYVSKLRDKDELGSELSKRTWNHEKDSAWS